MFKKMIRTLAFTVIVVLLSVPTHATEPSEVTREISALVKKEVPVGATPSQVTAFLRSHGFNYTEYSHDYREIGGMALYSRDGVLTHDSANFGFSVAVTFEFDSHDRLQSHTVSLGVDRRSEAPPAPPAPKPVPADRGETITAGDLDRVYSAIKQDNWSRVEKEVTPLLQRRSPGQRFLIGRLRYIYIVSLAKQVENRKLKYADFKRKLVLVENSLIVQPWHPVNHESSACFSQICADRDDPATLLTVQANHDATQIYSFEYFDMKVPLEIASFDGENARLGGTLDEIDINKNLPEAEKTGSGVGWYLKLHVKDGFMDYER